MTATERLSDHDHPLVQAKADELTNAGATRMDGLECLFHFVRDEIRFGFPPRWDAVKASKTLEYGIGYCNTKATLLIALNVADAPRSSLIRLPPGVEPGGEPEELWAGRRPRLSIAGSGGKGEGAGLRIELPARSASVLRLS